MSRSRAFRAVIAMGLAVLLTALTGCGDMPRPFAHDNDDSSPLARLTTAAGVTVVPPADAPPAVAQAAAEALAAAFTAADLPAQARPEAEAAALGGYVVRASLNGESVVWELLSPEGRTLRLLRQDRPDRLTPETARTLAEAAAPELRGTIDRDAEAPLVARMAAPAPPPLPDQDTRPQVAIARIDGLPEGRARILRAALASQLTARGIEVVEEAPLKIAGHLQLGEETAEGRPLTVVWTVFHADGRTAGSADQANTVPTALWAERFPAFAGAIAQGAAEGVASVIKRTSAP